MSERAGEVREDPTTDVQVALDIGLEAADRVLRERLGRDGSDLIILARIPADRAGHNEGFDSCIGASIHDDEDEERRTDVVRSMLERALRALDTVDREGRAI
jgi:hypothetical protein